MPQWGEEKEGKEDQKNDDVVEATANFDKIALSDKKPDNLRTAFTNCAQKHFSLVKRDMFASRVYRVVTPEAVVAVGAILRKMFEAKSSSKMLAHGHPLRPYLQFKLGGYNWVTTTDLHIKFVGKIPDGHTSTFIVLDYLGSGRDGRVSLCCGLFQKEFFGAVLKFCSEAKMWREIRLPGGTALFPKSAR
jgi:hypothetical protein